MLQNLREHVQGWIAGLIAGVLCLAFALWGIEYYITGTSSQKIVAKVNGTEITQNQWDAAYNRARQSQQLQFNDPQMNEVFQNQLKTRALGGLVQGIVLEHGAQKAGYAISPAQVGALIQHIPIFQLEGHFSYPLFQRTLENLSYTPENFSAEIAKSTLLTQVQRSVVESNFALPQDVDNDIVLQNQTRSFGYALIAPTLFLAKTTVTSQMVEDYYKAHDKDFMLPEKVSLQYLQLSTDAANKKVTVTDAELAQYYEENKASFVARDKAPATFAATSADLKAKIKKALLQQKIEQWVAAQSDKLANITYTHPDNLKPAADALELPIQTTLLITKQGEKKGLLANPKVLAAAFSDNVLKQRNNSDLIVVDNQTAVVLRVAEYKPPALQPLAEVRPNIEKYLKQQAAQKAAAALGEKIQQAVNAGGSPQQLVQQNKLSWLQKNNISRTAKEIPRPILDLAFNQPSPNSKPVLAGKSLPDGNYVILSVNKVVPGTLKTADTSQRQTLQKQLQNNFGSLDYDLYLLQQMNSAKIKMMEEK